MQDGSPRSNIEREILVWNHIKQFRRNRMLRLPTENLDHQFDNLVIQFITIGRIKIDNNPFEQQNRLLAGPGNIQTLQQAHQIDFAEQLRFHRIEKRMRIRNGLF
ncbi:hypothetical protein MIMGU_mgv1a016864mg [Erythranthe guttata]|uniref:Uncharacterized protein n=1 Tax=Erythranthe guttata TaxID=4155 RepID=A0A022RAD2_ERYGU|nr:hypothetical protein MIMGU_mgv1a016864mg [Erythranthe guttata]